jgi:hypothetical protein
MIRAIIAVAYLTFGAAASAQDVPRILNTKTTQWRLSLPADYQRELDRIAPGIAIFTDARYMERFHVDSVTSPSAIIRDLNGDHRPEVFLAGSVGDTVLVVGLITSPTGITGRVLHRRGWLWDDRRYVNESLSVQKERGRTWIRWQHVDCKGDGWEFRVVRQTTTTRKSACSYGE